MILDSRLYGVRKVITVGRLAVIALAAVLMTTSVGIVAAEVESSLARGGRLYDKWFAEIGADIPEGAHPSYPPEGKYYGKKGSDHRCKECHGWDYMGKDGAYASGKHSTGIKGINGMKGADTASIIEVLKNPDHGYGDKLKENDLADLANFISQGQVDMNQYIDRATKAPKGDAAKGEAYYNTICANCHGRDGKLPEEMKPFSKQMGNPWEVMHKILNGQPAEDMPALRALDRQIAVDIMAHLATFPKE